MKQTVILLLAVLLAACGMSVTGDEGMKTEQELYQGDVQRITIQSDKHGNKAVTVQEQIQAITKELQKAVAQDVQAALPAPEYVVTLEQQDGMKQVYHVWLTGEERRGWLQAAGADKLYTLPRESVTALLAVFPVAEPPAGTAAPIEKITKKDLKLTRFLIQSDENAVTYTLSYKLSEALYAKWQGEAYYMQLAFPVKVRNMLGRESSGIVQGETVKDGYMQYDIVFRIPAQQLSASQRQALEQYYEGYNVTIYDAKQKEQGAFADIIAFVKEYGAQMDRQP